MADPLVDVAVLVYADFAERDTLAEVLAVIARAAPTSTPTLRRFPNSSNDWPGNAWPAGSDQTVQRLSRRRTTQIRRSNDQVHRRAGDLWR